MKKTLLFAALASLSAAGLTSPALADNHGNNAKSPEIVERNSRGQATKVRIEGKVYDVCMGDDKDGCINPRAAGLKWGNRPLDHWPGKPASEM